MILRVDIPDEEARLRPAQWAKAIRDTVTAVRGNADGVIINFEDEEEPDDSALACHD